MRKLLGDARGTLYMVSHKQLGRLTASFLFAVMLTATFIPTASAVVFDAQDNTSRDYAGPLATPVNDTPIPDSQFKLTPLESATQDALQAVDAGNGPILPVGEVVEKRTATSTLTRNEDGSYTQEQYLTPQFYKSGKEWKKISTKLAEDKNAGDSSNLLGKLYGQVKSAFTDETTFTVTENDWYARFAKSNNTDGMVRIKQGDSQIGFVPVGAATVAPKIVTDKEGHESVWYYNLWPGVDVQYEVKSSHLKENILIKDKKSTGDFSFKMIGGNLQKSTKPAEEGIAYEITDALGNNFSIAPFVISLNKYGFEANQPITQSLKDNVLSVGVDKSYLQALPNDAFPVTIDPIVQDGRWGDRNGANFGGDSKSFKSDGYVCPASVCNAYAGTVQDAGGTWRAWRGAVYTPFSFLQGKTFISATLHLKQRLGLSSSGSTVQRYFTAAHHTCHDFNCVGEGAPGWALINQEGDIDVSNIYRSRISAGDWGAWLKIIGEENVAYTTYKNWDPDNSYVRFTYAHNTPVPTIASPASNNQVFVDPQVSFRSTEPGNPNSGSLLKYNFCVSSSSGCSGTVINSGWIDAPTWTVPDGVLQDGSSYKVQVRAQDPDGGGGVGAWSSAVSFKIDTRQGKNKTQTYEDIGPVSVDYATGNLSTGNASHSSAALGGSLGVSLDYNSPVRSRSGLVGEYWNNKTFSGTPLITRVDQNVDFNWAMGSPASGTIPNDNYSARWTGYFVAPAAGNYQFGGSNDDNLKVIIGGQVAYDSGGCHSGVCYGGSTVSLAAGQAVPITVELIEGTWTAYARLFVKGPVAEQAVPSAWLQTSVRQVTQYNGLVGTYYNDDGSHNLDAANKTAFLSRIDPTLSFNWPDVSPVPGGAVNFMTRWTGYVTVPESGTYLFGTLADDGSRVKINGATVLDNWSSCCSKVYGSGVTLTAGTSYSITVDHYDSGGPASMNLYVKKSGSTTDQIVPTSWLSPKAQVLPDGWNLGIDADGNVSYDRLKVNQNSVVLTDSSGSTHEYTWTGSGYKPPVNEGGYLVRNADGTFTLQDVDGRTYVFATSGELISLTNPIDDRQPAALKYVYGGVPAKIQEIQDGVDPTGRWAKVYYSGAAECGSAPAGFDGSAPSGMLCAVKTNDGRTTNFYYKTVNSKKYLARIQKPGNDITDYSYDVLGRLVAVRDSLANDAIAANVRVDNNSVLTEVEYDVLGRATAVKAPAATEGGDRRQVSLSYLPAAANYRGAVEARVTGASEPHGFTQRVEYDSLYRTTKRIDKANLATVQEWDVAEDLLLSTIDPTGLKSTTIYDIDDRPTDSYGPAPAAWFGTNRKPLAAYVSQVPRAETKYDEGLVGPAVSYHGYKSGSLVGAPRLRTTGTVPENPGFLNKNWSTPPITINTAAGETGFGFRATGKLSVPSTNTYYFSLWHNDGVRMYIDDQLVVNDWVNGAVRGSSGSKLLEAGKSYRFLLEYYDADGQNSGTDFYISPGSASTAATYRYWTNYIKPDYSLVTSTKTYDNTIGDVTATTNHGTKPELGQAQSATIDPSGLNLATSATYEPYQAGSLMRQTSKTLPGGTTTNYAYYNATETRDNPCTPETETFKQAGFIKQKTEQDPDGAGEQTGRTSETAYDDAGRAVASRLNNDPWTCATYDTRGRVTQTVVPTINGRAGRTVTTNYTYQGSPLKVQVVDSVAGTTVSEVDLLGRSVSSTDTFGNVSTATYDTQGRLESKTTPLGTENYTYDTYDRVTEYKHNDTTYATIAYDQYSRVQDITYNQTQESTTTTGPGPNLIPNSSLETASQSNPNVPAGWQTDAWGANTAIFTYPNEGHTGTRSVKTELTSHTDGDAKWHFSQIDAAPNTNYTFKTYFKSNTGSDVVAQFTDQSGNLSYLWLGWQPASSGWSQAAYDFTTPANTTKISIFHVIDSVGWLQIDDSELYVTSQTTTTNSGSAMKLEQIKRDALQRNNGAVFRFSNGQALDETVTKSQSGMVTGYSDSFNGGTATSTYAYDKAGRLTAANIDGNTYTYGYNAPTGCTGAYNPNAHKNSNRTSFTVNGVTKTYCYNQADQLISSTDTQLGTPTYDDHGNTISLAGGGTPVTFTYDASDSNTAIQQGDYKVEYLKTATGSVLRKKEYQNNVLTKSYRYLAGGAVLQSCELANDNSCTTTDAYLGLPGGTTLSLSPTNPDTTKRTIYSIKNFHGDTAITAGSTGLATSSVFLYEPFGTTAPSSTFSTNSNPTNATDQSMGWAADPTRKVAGAFTIPIIQMGARVYLPTAGRFLQVDPVEGGTLNAYVYAHDPVNADDYTGEYINPLLSILATIAKMTAIKSKAVATVVAKRPAAVVQRTIIPQAAQSQSVASKLGSGVVSGASAVGAGVVDGVGWVGKGLQRGYQNNSDHIVAGVVGCGVGIAGSAIFTYATAGAGQFELSAYAVGTSCLIGGTSAVVKSVSPQSGPGVDSANQLKDTFDIYWYLLRR